ncbi:serine hydrolase [Mucilaginibacter galii]
MRKVIIIILSVVNACACCAQNAHKPITDNALRTSLDTLINTSVSAFMRSGNRVGISIGVLNNGKSFIYNYGSTTPGQQRLPTGNSVYELASITKTFSSALLAQAVIDKKAKLDDDIRLYLDEEYPNLEYKGTPIKLVNLANLTSGLPNWMPDNKDLFNNANPDSIPYILDALHKKYTRTDLYRDLHWVNLDIVPGSVTKHCNTAAQLLGYIMEKVYGAPLEMVLRKQLTGPLNMNNTTFLTEGNLPAALVKGYDGKGKLMPFIVWDDLKVAASLSSTVADMLKYVAYEMDEHKAEVNLSHQPTNGKPEMGAIALNWKINQTATNGLKISHTGGSLGFSTYMVFYPHAKMGIVLLTNEADPATQGELISLADKVLGSK